jgi:RNA polymerase sigma-70 factor (ECF subfamily)
VNPEDTAAAQWYADNLQVHEAALRAWLRVKFPILTDRDNLVQESLTRVWRLKQRDEIRSPKALLFTTARNLAIDELRRRNLAPVESIEEIDGLSVLDDGATASETVALKQEIELVIQAIQSLSPRCREVLTLRKIYGLSQKEIAAQLHISEATVETHVCNGLRGCTRFFARLGLP